jgi:hypothetical protein
MKLTKLSLAMTAVIGMGATADALALDLYVDTKTQQIYAEPGLGRVKLGAFERVEDAAQKAEVDTIKQDLELKTNELKALEEHVVANREDKAKNDEKWFNKINMRGYTQMRYNQPLNNNHTPHGEDVSKDTSTVVRSPGDSSIGENANFSLRRARLVFSGDITDYIAMYIQTDFASTSGDLHFAQLRDAYFDLSWDKAHEYRIRAGQSKVPFGWENLQSSQNRIALDRDDALNSAVPSERDLGLFAYWSPSDVQSLWKSLSKKGLKTSGDYGVLGLGIYNGQGTNKAELNDDVYVVAHSTYPFKLGFMGMPEQVVEVGVDAMSGRFNKSPSEYCYEATTCTTKANATSKKPQTTITPKTDDRSNDNSEDRVGVHAILFPQPFGLQAEWNWGAGPTLNPDANRIERAGLGGGYVQAMYKIDEVFGTKGTMIPYVKWQTYDGAWKNNANAPREQVDEVEAGVEYQINKALEVTLAYSHMERTNIASATSNDFLKMANGDLIRTQLQVNY